MSWLPSIWEPRLRQQQTGRAESALTVPVTGGDGSSSCLSPGLPKPEDKESLKTLVTAAESVASRLLLFTISLIHMHPKSSAQQQQVLQLMCGWQEQRLAKWETLHRTGWRWEGLVAARLNGGDSAALGATEWAAAWGRQSHKQGQQAASEQPGTEQLYPSHHRRAGGSVLEHANHSGTGEAHRQAPWTPSQEGQEGCSPMYKIHTFSLSSPAWMSHRANLHTQSLWPLSLFPCLPVPGRRAGWSYCKTVREGAAFCAVIFCLHHSFSTASKLSRAVLCITPHRSSVWAARSAAWSVPSWAWQGAQGMPQCFQGRSADTISLTLYIWGFRHLQNLC